MHRPIGYAALVATLMLAGCLPPPRALVAAGPPIYCYSTLADVDCYLQPVPTDRLVGAAVPLAPVAAYYVPAFYD